MKNHYLTLEINVSATTEQIKKAYRLKAVKYHPDKHFGDKYFTEKFIEVKQAYDILSDPIKRKAYDIEYKAFFTREETEKQQIVREEKRKETEKEEQFFYDPHKPFYSFQDRKVNETPQFEPKINIWGGEISDLIDFFILPKNIGKIISGYATIFKHSKPSTNKEKFKTFIKIFGISIIFALVLILLFKVVSPIWIIIWFIIPLLIGIWLTGFTDSFSGTCFYIGVNGLAYFKCEGDRENITESYEINFNDVTDLISIKVTNKTNFNYTGTDYSFVWLNNKKIIKEVNGSHDSEEGKPSILYFDFWLHEKAEKYWTIYLLDNMEKVLESKGYLEFNLFEYSNNRFNKIPYIHLGIGYIKFLTSKGEAKYNFNEIKQIYTKGNNLFIEHLNYEKKFFFFESGNKNGIPLSNLSNRLFFFKAIELLIGYKLV